VEAGLNPEPGRAPLAVGEPFVDLPVGHVGVRAPQLAEKLGVEVGVVGDVARLGAEHGNSGVGKLVGDEAAVHRGGDRSDALADDDDLGGVGIVLGEVAERRRAVDEAVVFDGGLGRVLPGGIAEVHVTGAGRHPR
jgi:hypothetical protein